MEYDSGHNDPADWKIASYSAHPVDTMEPLPDDALNGYREAALHYLRIMLIIDQFIEAAPDARLAVIAVSLVLQWPSTRGLSIGNIAGQLGVSAATITRACARFCEISGLPAGGFQFVRPGAG